MSARINLSTGGQHVASSGRTKGDCNYDTAKRAHHITRLAGLAANKCEYPPAHAKVAADWRDILAMPEAAQLTAGQRKYFTFLAARHERKGRA